MMRYTPAVTRFLTNGVMVAVLAGGCTTGLPPADTNDNDNTAPSMIEPADPTPPDAVNDPLSRPATPTLSPENFRTSSSCAPCHPNHAAEWKNSLHAYATKDPIWRSLVAIRQADFDGARDQFCVQCHTAIGTRGGEVFPGFSFDDFSAVSLEGVTCESCHKVSGMERVYNSGHILDETGPMRGPIQDPTENPVHESVYSPLHDTSEFCGGCHDVIEQNNLNLERPYEEWVPSPAATEGRNCQSCHMPTYTGKAAVGSDVPERTTLHRHRFTGTDVPLSNEFISDPELRAELLAESVALLRSAGEIVVDTADSVQAGQQLELYVTVRNLIDAHNLPTGSTFNRQLWIEATATDAEGRRLYQTGHLDDNGDLRNYWSELDPSGDSDLIEFGSRFVDQEGNPTLFPWRAAEHISNALAPLSARTSTFFVPTDSDTTGPITVTVRLRYRAMPPFLIRTLGLDELLENLEIVDMAEHTVTVEVGS